MVVCNLRNCVSSLLRYLGIYLRVSLVSFWDTLGSLWCYIGTPWGYFGGHLEVALGTLLATLWVNLGKLLGHFGGNQGVKDVLWGYLGNTGVPMGKL